MNDDSWEDAPIQFVPLPSCPCCNASGKSIKQIRTMPRESDGSFHRRYRCQLCSRKFKVVFEVPEIGSDERAIS